MCASVELDIHEENLFRLKSYVNKILHPGQELYQTFDYSYLLCTNNLVMELSKVVIVQHPPPYYSLLSFLRDRIKNFLESSYCLY